VISISRFLLISLLLALFSLSSIASWFSYRDATHEVEELFDAELAQMARVLQSLLQDQLKRGRMTQLAEALKYNPIELGQYVEGEEATPFGHRYENKLAFMVWNGDSDELLSSFSTTSTPFSLVPQQGYSSASIDNYHWRTFTLREAGLDLWITVGQRDDVRAELTSELVHNALLPLFMIIPLLALVIWFIVKWGLSPLRRVSHQIIERNPDHLLPLSLQRVPAEIGGVVRSVNSLMASLHSALSRERRFTADAAHELRTPLAGIRIHAQNITRQQDPATVAAASQIIGGVDRMTRVVEQLMTLSRLEHQHLELTSVDLSPVLRQTLADQASHAPDKKLDYGLETSEGIHVHGNPDSLAILCRNLIDNAIRYTPDGGEVVIRLQQEEDRVLLRVCDTGPGIPASQREAVLQRFVRLAGQSIDGSGLGLSIVQAITQQHGGELVLSDSPLAESGLCVSVRLPLAQQTPHLK